jgi:signal peptidase I
VVEPAGSERRATAPPLMTSKGGAHRQAEAGSKRSSGARSLIEWVVIIVAALVVAFLIKTFLVQAFYIPSASMEPTLKPGDRVLVYKLSYSLHSVHRGDVVVFKKPASDDDPGVTDLIKRVIGLPGETISCAKGPTSNCTNSDILIDGKPIPQPWLKVSPSLGVDPFTNPGPQITNQNQLGVYDCANKGTLQDYCVIPQGEYFMMGDNRGDSSDSRAIGPIPKDLLVGRAFVLVWPLGRLHWF